MGPSLLPTALEEMLRYVTPVNVFFRTATKATELRGVRVKKGDRAAMFYPSANRDETQFADPDRFDVSRTPNPHVAFGGGGTHFCLGGNLARVEATAIVSEVLSRMKNLELAGGGRAPAAPLVATLSPAPRPVHAGPTSPWAMIRGTVPMPRRCRGQLTTPCPAAGYTGPLRDQPA